MIRLEISPGAYGVFTERAGGVSRPPYGAPDGGGGLNLGMGVEDAPEDVAENRHRLSETLGTTVEWMSQVHGRDVRVVSGPTGRASVGVADALLVDDPSLAPAVLVADCVPVLLATESGSLRAAVHVGRRGLQVGVLPAAVDVIAGRSGEQVFAVAGPSICARCYEVSGEMSEEYAAIGAASTTQWGTPGIDLLAGIRRQLAGIPLKTAGVCTLEDDRFFSYRRDGRTGRCAGVAMAL